MKSYGIKMSDGSWLLSCGIQSVQTYKGYFPPNTFSTKEKASAEIDYLMRHHPNMAVDCSIIEIKVTMKEVFADPSERTAAA